jgi:hypothetical protein
MLDTLDNAGPFTNSVEVGKFLVDPTWDDNIKQQFVRESTTLLPKVDSIFRIQNTLPSGKRKNNTAPQFGNVLLFYLGMRNDRTTLAYKNFQHCLDKLASL